MHTRRWWMKMRNEWNYHNAPYSRRSRVTWVPQDKQIEIHCPRERERKGETQTLKTTFPCTYPYEYGNICLTVCACAWISLCLSGTEWISLTARKLNSSWTIRWIAVCESLWLCTQSTNTFGISWERQSGYMENHLSKRVCNEWLEDAEDCGV